MEHCWGTVCFTRWPLHRRTLKNESANLLIASKVYVLVIPGKDSATILKSIIDIAGGVSDLVYYEKLDKKGSFIAYISLIYSDKIAVLDLDSMDSGNTQISYIVNVGSVYSAPGMHSVSRRLVASGPWLVTPASANQSLAIINIATQELYGMVKDVVGARGMVAAYSPRPNPIGTMAHIGHPLIFFTVYISNSNFYCKNPSCSISKFATRIFTAKIRVVCVSKFATRILTAEIRVVCISKFATRIFTAKILVVCFKICNSNFNRRNSSCVHF